MHLRALVIALVLGTSATAVADDIPDVRPTVIEPLKIDWFDVDGKPLPYKDIEGWLLKDPASRPHVLRRKRMTAWGTALSTFGGSVLVVGTGIAIRNATEDDERGFAEVWAPILTGAALTAAGIPLIVLADRQGRRAAEVYGTATVSADGGGVYLGATF